MIISKEPAYVVGHAGNLIGPADALLVLEVTHGHRPAPHLGQRLHDGIPHINWQTSARALPLNLRHPRPGPASASDPNGTGERNDQVVGTGIWICQRGCSLIIDEAWRVALVSKGTPALGRTLNTSWVSVCPIPRWTLMWLRSALRSSAGFATATCTR